MTEAYCFKALNQLANNKPLKGLDGFCIKFTRILEWSKGPIFGLH